MPRERQQLNQREIDQVLGHYMLGAVHSITELAAGSVYSPKVVIESDRGKLLLKRRARGLDLPPIVAFSHEVLLGCLRAGFCVPPLLATSPGNNSMVQFEDHVYELFVYIEGVIFDRSPSMIGHHAAQAGALLSEVHRTLDTIETSFEPPIEPTPIDLSRLSTLETRGSGCTPEMRDRFGRILRYGDELARANAEGPALVHGDWHPGNMIYRGTEIVSACDFDNTRIGSRAREVAQAMVHFSLKAPLPGQRAQDCEPEPDPVALSSFWAGYQSGGVPACTARVCAGLMPAVMIDEALAAFPSRTPDGASDQILTAVSRKASWMDEHQSEMIEMLESVANPNPTGPGAV